MPMNLSFLGTLHGPSAAILIIHETQKSSEVCSGKFALRQHIVGLVDVEDTLCQC